MENYFAEQPSGRNLLHVNPRVGSSNPPAGSGAQARAIGEYAERPSGRGLVHQDGSEVSTAGPGREGGVRVSPEVSEDDSSRWDDSDAMSGLPYGGQSAFHTEAASAYRSSEAVESAFDAVAAMDRAEIDPLDYSEGSAAASRIGGDSVLMVGAEDTAAGGSSVGGGVGGGALSGYGGTVASRESRQQQLREAQEQRNYLLNQSSTSSSMASRVDAPQSELGGNTGIIGHSSWRSSPHGAGGIDRVMSGDTSDSSALMDGRAVERQDTQEDGDFGTVWLANRAHARQYDAQGRS